MLHYVLSGCQGVLKPDAAGAGYFKCELRESFSDLLDSLLSGNLLQVS